MKIKKFLSVILSITLIFNQFFAKDVYANSSEFSEDECWKNCTKNSKGGYDDELCAGKEAEKILLSGEKAYVVMKDVGPLADQEVYFFTFRALDKILDELGLDPDEDKLREELQRLEKERKSSYSTLKNMLKVCLGSLMGALGGNGVYALSRSKFKKHNRGGTKFSRENKLYNLANSEIKKEHTEALNWPAGTVFKLGLGKMMFIGAVCIGLITSILLKIKYDIAKRNENEIFNKQYKIFKINEKKSYPLNRILKHIKDSDYLFKDNETLFSVHTEPKQLWMFYPGDLEGLNYTEEEKANLPEKMKKLAQDLKENLGRRLWRD